MKSYSLFRFVGYAEGISFLVLLGIAMPLKYFADSPEAVSVVGMLHGVLFVLYIAAIVLMTILHRWSLKQIAGAAIASIIPFGPFVFDRSLHREYQTKK